MMRSLTVLYFVLTMGFTATAEEHQPLPEDAMQTEEVKAMIASRFPNAPDLIRKIATTVAAGGVPDSLLLGGVDQIALNISYSQPFPKRHPTYGHTLLREAMLAGNLAAAGALIRQGANIAFNDNELPYHAIRQITGPRDLWFPNFSSGNQMVSLWLESGGDVDATHKGESSGSLLLAAPMENLEGILILLDSGADPWKRPPVRPGSALMQPSFHEKTANANVQFLEVAFRVAQAGYYRNPVRETADHVMDRFDDAADFLNGSTGPAALAKIWAVQMVLKTVLQQMDRPPTPAQKTLLQTQLPADVGGFFLGPDELRSQPNPSQKMTNDNQFGSQVWDAVE